MKITEQNLIDWIEQFNSGKIKLKALAKAINDHAEAVEWFTPGEKMPKDSTELVVVVSAGSYKYQQHLQYFRSGRSWFKNNVHHWRIREPFIPIPE